MTTGKRIQLQRLFPLLLLLLIASSEARGQERPLLLIHGFCGGSETWDRAKALMVDAGVRFEAPTLDVPPDGTNDDPRRIAELLGREVAALARRHNTEIDIVAHSMGGLSTREYLRSLQSAPEISDVVMLGTPNHGAYMADLLLVVLRFGGRLEDAFAGAKLDSLRRRVAALLKEHREILKIAISHLGPFACVARESPALEALRPHGAFLRQLNGSDWDAGSPGQPSPNEGASNARLSVIAGEVLLPTISHKHLPEVTARIAGLGGPELETLVFMTVAPGDLVVPVGSALLGGAGFASTSQHHVDLTSDGPALEVATRHLWEREPISPAPALITKHSWPARILGAGRGFSGRRLMSSRPVEIVPAALGGARGRRSLGFVPAARLSSPTWPVVDSRFLRVDPGAERLSIGLSWRVDPFGGDDSEREHLSLELVPPGFDRPPPSRADGVTTRNGRGWSSAEVARPEQGDWRLDVLATDFSQRQFEWIATQEARNLIAIGFSRDLSEASDRFSIAAWLESAGEPLGDVSVYAAVALPTGAVTPVTLDADPGIAGLYRGEFRVREPGTYSVLAAAAMPESTATRSEPVIQLGFGNFTITGVPDDSRSADPRRPRLIFGPRPRYPPLAEASGIEGPVEVKLTVDAKGNVVTPVVVSGLTEPLNRAALEAVQQWKYVPALREGEPVAAEHSVTVIFDLERVPSW